MNMDRVAALLEAAKICSSVSDKAMKDETFISEECRIAYVMGAMECVGHLNGLLAMETVQPDASKRIQ